MKITRTIALVGLPLVLAACKQEDDMPQEMPQVVEAPAVDPIGVEPQVQAEPSGMGVTARLQPLNESGVTGDAALTESAAGTEVMVRLAGAPAGEHAGHIHQGTCESLGSVVAPLQPITAAGDGTGTMTTTVDVPLMTAADGQHVIAYHGAGGQPIACTPIPAHQM